MQEFDKIGEDLFNKIRGRFPSITIGNEAGEVINEPTQARFFDFEYKKQSCKRKKEKEGEIEDSEVEFSYPQI